MTEPDGPLFKIFRAAEWQAFQASGHFAGSADDRRDGFIHLSAGRQVAGTLTRHFGGEGGLMLAEVLVGDDPALRWETSRGGAAFPHLYRPLAVSDIGKVIGPLAGAEAPAI
jgi:uncharacterized protein (DUF952 family)